MDDKRYDFHSLCFYRWYGKETTDNKMTRNQYFIFLPLFLVVGIIGGGDNTN
jgi:hypothetical protein